MVVRIYGCPVLMDVRIDGCHVLMIVRVDSCLVDGCLLTLYQCNTGM